MFLLLCLFLNQGMQMYPSHNMKKSCQRIFSILLLLFVLSAQVFAQKGNSTTIILIRHAEKDTSAAGSTLMQADPPLSKVGKLRAEKLVSALQDYPIQAIHSTRFNRTRSTVIPISSKISVGIQLYDPAKQAEFAQILKLQKNSTILVVGHSNTIPNLVNLLTGTSQYANLDDNEYDKIFIVTLKDGKALVEQMVY